MNRDIRPQPFRRHPQYEERLVTIHKMLAEGHTQTEIGVVLGISRRRVGQLAMLIPTVAKAS